MKRLQVRRARPVAVGRPRRRRCVRRRLGDDDRAAATRRRCRPTPPPATPAVDARPATHRPTRPRPTRCRQRDRLALADGTPRCCSPSAPATRWSPSTTTPTTRPRRWRSRTTCRASSPTSRRSPATSPTSSSSRRRHRPRRPARGRSASPSWVGPAATTFDDIYAQIEQLGAATGHVAEAAELVGQMQTDIDARSTPAPTPDAPLTLLPRARPRRSSAPRRTRSSARSTRCSGCRTSPTRPRRRHRLPAAERRVRSSPPTPI